MMYKGRLNHKIASYIVKGGYFDTVYNYSSARIARGIEDRDNKRLHRYYYGDTQRWRGALPFGSALSSLVKNYGVPIWFLKRSYKYIARNCIWEKSSSWDNNSYYILPYYIEKKEWRHLKYAGATGSGILKSCSLPLKHTKYRKEKKVIDGEEYYRKVPYKVDVIDIETTDRMGIVVSEVVNYYRNVQAKYYRIHGVDCKICNKNVKHTKSDIICNDLLKYTDHICPKCLKKFCKLTDATRDIRFAKMEAA